jgi:hypothetical protein
MMTDESKLLPAKSGAGEFRVEMEIVWYAAY